MYHVYKDNNTNNKSTKPNDALHGAGGENHYFIFQIIIKTHNRQIFTNGINPYNIDIEYIWHTDNLHIGEGIKFQGRPRRQHRWRKY